MDLNTKLQNCTARCGVIGLGYVGLPLMVRLGRAGFTVVGIDLSQERVEQLVAGRSYIGDISSDEIEKLVTTGKLLATTDYDAISTLDTVNICVPTPLGKSRAPDLSHVISALEAIRQRLHPAQLIILESTTYPGTSDEVALPILEQSGLKCGEDFFFAFSPERIDPGNRSFPLEGIPKIVGGITPRCTELATTFYQHLVTEVVPVSSARTAEMAKLLENTFRIVNIGMANELALLADDLDVDVWEVIDAAATKPFGFMPFYPGPGLGGHCIPVDPFYLSWKVREHGREAQFIELAGEINRQMPAFVVEKITEALNDQCHSVKGARVLILGVTYKKDVADTREAAALDIIRLLKKRGAQVRFHDPLVPTLRVGEEVWQSVELTEEELRVADCVVVVADHSSYDYAWLVTHSRLLVDTRNATRSMSPNGKIYRLGTPKHRA
jgi:UDP-N-acetyl-D-glucosamine dehydrogenase